MASLKGKKKKVFSILPSTFVKKIHNCFLLKAVNNYGEDCGQFLSTGLFSIFSDQVNLIR